MEKTTVRMRVKELVRVHMIRQALEQRLAQAQTETLLGLTVRQIRRIMTRVWREGDRGFSSRAIAVVEPADADAGQVQVQHRSTQHYGDFEPTLAAERLAERHRCTLGVET